MLEKLIVKHVSALALVVTVSSIAHASEIRLTTPSVGVTTIKLSDFFPTGSSSPETTEVFVIEFSSSSDLRELSKRIDALVMPFLNSCNGDKPLNYEGYFIADSKGVIGVAGMIGQVPRMPLPPVGRYLTFLSRDDGKSLSTLQSEPFEDACMNIGVINADGLPSFVTEPLIINIHLLRSAWDHSSNK